MGGARAVGNDARRGRPPPGARLTDAECVAFLQWALPRLGLRWEGFRKVRRQVCRRVTRRIEELGLDGTAGYRRHLEHHPGEWGELDSRCRVTISRFGRDRGVLSTLRDSVLPALADAATERPDRQLRVWSAGCACGEEPYTVELLWRLELVGCFPGILLSILGTDVDEAVLARAREALYPRSSLRELPPGWVDRAFLEEHGRLRLRPELTAGVSFATHDVRTPPPPGPFDLVLCRNLAFTYLDADTQALVADRLAGAIRSRGALVVGAQEVVPGHDDLGPWHGAPSVWRRA